LSEIKFFDRLGRARAYCLDGVHIYLWDGTPAAFLRFTHLMAVSWVGCEMVGLGIEQGIVVFSKRNWRST
jgi:hypothetical protein